MSVPSQKKQSWTPQEDGQQGAEAGSYYYYSPHSAAPGSERSWQESYNQMARRVTGGPSSWGQHYQQPPPSHSHSTYGQQQYQYSMFQGPNQSNASTATASDPWNWGWEESGNSESGNNNAQQDPTWDWSVDGSNGYQQQPAASNTAVNYNPEVHRPQVWPSPALAYGNESQQHHYNNVPQNVLDDSFTSSTVANQNSYNQQPVVFQTVNKTGQNFCSFGSSDSQGLHPTNNSSVTEHKHTPVPVSSENSNRIVNHSQNYSSGFFSGFPVGSNDVGFHQSQGAEYRLQGSEAYRQEDNKPETLSTDVKHEVPADDKNSSLSSVTGSAECPHPPHFQEASKNIELLNTSNVKQEIKGSLSSSDSRTNTIEYSEDGSCASEDTKFGASASRETLPSSQWSTECVPSVGSEEPPHSLDGMCTNSLKKENLQENSYPQSYQYNCNKDQVPDISGRVHEISGNAWEQKSYTPDLPNQSLSEGKSVKQEVLSSSASPDNHNSYIQTSENSVLPSSVPIAKHSENKSLTSENLGASVGASSQQSMDNVANNLKSLSLGDTVNNNATDVENVEIAPPENNPPLGHHPRSDSAIPPPPTTTSVATGGGSNPYAARNATLNHKYANKHRILPSNPSSESVERMNYTMNLAQTEPEHGKKMSPHFMTPNEIGPPVYTSGNFSARNKTSVLPTTEEAVNLETVPDNKERPDFIDSQHSSQLDRKSVSPLGGTRPHANLGQDSARGPVISWSQQQSIYSMSPENQEVAPRCGPERNQYLETGQLPDDDMEVHGHVQEVGDNSHYHRSQPFLPPPGLHRMVPGQQTEQENVARAPLEDPNQLGSSVNEDVSTPPPGLHRMIPGQFTENEMPVIQENTQSNPSHQSAGTDDIILHRMVPGRLTEDTVVGSPDQGNTNDTILPAGSVLDEIPPPGLRRMVPGESSSPESQGNSTTILATGSTLPAGSFQPIDSVPMEPRVVTGVAQDEMDITGSQGTSAQLTPSPVQLSSSGRATSETESPSPEQSLTPSTLPQPPTERSETIGSDSVETYPPQPSDNSSRELSVRRDNTSKERDRRHREDPDSDERNRRRQTNAREYYGSREREESPSSGRYRSEDRERRPYDRERNRDREDSPSGSRYRYDSRKEYGRRGHEDEHRARHRRGYDRSDEDADTEGYYSDRDRDRKLDHERDNRERDRRDNPGYRDDYRHHYRGHSERDRGQREELEKGSRDRPDHRSGVRVSERDDRDRERYRDRRRYDYPDYHDYRRLEDYYGRGYEEDMYYRSTHRSRPNSRSGSRPEFEDDRRRDYRAYGVPAVDYYNQGLHSMYYQYHHQYHQYMAQWKQHVSQQGGYHPEDRGSVHSGRSSANEELHRERIQDQNSSAVDGVSSLPQRMSPAKFTTAHIKGVLSVHGQLLKTPAHYPFDGQPAVVELHSLQDVFRDDEIYKELKDFPGPLIRNVTHKNSVIGFCTRKIQKAERDPDLFDRDSVILFWRLLILLLKQNGTVVGSDIAELLLNSSSSESSKVQQPTPSPAVSQGSINDIQHEDRVVKTEEEVTNSYREFLLYGNTKEALEWAMKHGLWGHALFLASKMDQRTYANVMMRFANGLTMNDPLQTLYQLMSGRQPAAVTCCADEKWGDWRPHLAMIVSNSSQWENLHREAITTLGDTLATRGCLHAAHFCYVMAQLDFGTYSAKSSKIVLLGSSHTKSFSKFASNEAIQITEVYLYTIQLANPEFEAPHFQPYKLLYAQRLAEYGMTLEALQYVEVIAKAVMTQPACYDLSFLQRVYELGNQLRYHDPVFSEGEEGDASWLLRLATTIEAYMSGALQQEGPSYGSTSNLSYSEGDSLQPQYQGMDFVQSSQEPQYYNSWPQQPYQEMQQWQQQQQQPGIESRAEGYSQEQDAVPEQIQSSYVSHPEQGADNSPQEPHLPQQPQLLAGDEFRSRGGIGEEMVPSTDGQTDNSAFDYWNMSANKQEGGPQISLTGSVPLDEPGGPQPRLQHPPLSSEDKAPTKPKSRKEQPKNNAGSSWFGGIWNKLALRPKNQMILPDDKNPSIVWDPERKRWTNVDSEEDDTNAVLPPPPKTSQLPGSNIVPPAPGSAGDSGSNIYKMNRSRGSRANYVDVLGGKTATNPVIPAPALFQPPTTTPMNIFVPEPVETKDSNPVDFLSAPAISETSEQASGESSQTGVADIAVKPAGGGPLMFNPTSFSQPAAAHKGSGTLGRKRYPN
ncbi:protein transport protein Sec16A isoform X2 [Anabrus simplex]|uniref:protein transport protein Sec16A isoform X2 n=1 Tax=Anabrus simplex TaxID=316456 RepID=UPI0035A36EFB